MEDALQNSVYVSSPEFAGWLMKKGFRVSFKASFNHCYLIFAIFV
jgi:hypothetical protein